MFYVHRLALLLLSLAMLVQTPAFAKKPVKPGAMGPMRTAIAHLEAAQNAKDPLPSLRAARKSLVAAKPNKEGQRIDAIQYVDEAIALAITGDKKAMQEKITKAIGNAKSGIARAKS